jgi:hypothetical protein
MGQMVFRFLIGGAVVSLFAALGDALKPKSFAGLFGAAPSVALATLSLTVVTDGKAYASLEGRSMVLAAFAFWLYAWGCSRLLRRFHVSALFVTTTGLLAWGAASVALWAIFVGHR